MKPNVIVALALGVVIGIGVGRVFSSPSARATATAGTADESSFRYKSTDFPAETWTGMNDGQKYAVMKVLNENTCDCGCSFGTYASCLKNDPNCPKSPAMLKQAIALARAGKTSDQIQMELFKKPATAPGAGVAQQQQPQQQRPAPVIPATVFKVPVDAANPVLGKADAPVTIIEFSDYQCPFCTRANETMKQVEKEYGDKVRIVMKQLPLENMHPLARGAAKAALAAGEQGKYWEYHHKLFENIRELDDANLVKKAELLGLDVAKFNKSRQDPKWDKVIDADKALASKMDVNGTPGFFINGRKLGGAYPFDTFKKVIDEELVKAEALVKSGTPASQVYAKIIEKGLEAPPRPAAPAAQFAKVDVPADSPSFGPENAKVTIVEWSDFQCPFCSRALPVVKQIKEKYPNDVRFVFRHQPLRSIHPQAQLAAEASMAAHEQGKFWEMHDLMFANARKLDRTSIEGYAQQLGLDMNKFKAALDSQKYKNKVDEDSKAGIAIGAGGTPTFFINGRKQVGAGNFEVFRSIIDQEIAKANKLLASGVKPDKLYERIIADNTAK